MLHVLDEFNPIKKHLAGISFKKQEERTKLKTDRGKRKQNLRIKIRQLLEIFVINFKRGDLTIEQIR